MRPRFNLVPALILGAHACLLEAPLRAENRFFIGEVTVPEKAADQKLDVHCEHDVAARAYSLSIQYDSKAMRVTSIGHEGTSVENPDFWGDTSREGEIALGVVLDTTSPLTRYLPPASDHTLARVTFDVIGKAGTTSPIAFKDDLGQFNPVDNVLTNESGRDVPIELTNGTLRIVAPAATVPIANAGPDQIVPEVSRVEIDASRSHSPEGKSLVFAWRQTGGPPVQELSGQDTSQISFTVPPVGGDSEITFELVVTETGSAPSKTAKDEVKVFAIDLDQRRGALQAVPGAAQVIDGATRAILFQGDLSWNSAMEDGFWTRMRFTPGGAGDESTLLRGTSLHWDSNSNGVFDASDEKLGGTETVAVDGDPVEFTFFELLRNGETRRFFLVADLEPQGSRGFLLPLAILGAGLGATRRARRAGSRARRAVFRGLIILLVAAAALVPVACGGGGGGGRGGGGGGGQPTVSREVRFDVVAPNDVGLQGTETGVQVGASGAPIQGPALDLRTM